MQQHMIERLGALPRGLYEDPDVIYDLLLTGKVAEVKRSKRLLYFFLLDQGIYIAERGFMALSLVVGAAETQRLLGALESFIKRYRHLLVASA